MKRVLIMLGATILIFSCKNSTVACIDAKIESLNEGNVVLTMLDVNNQKIIDTIKTDDEGVFRYKIKKLDQTPEFYYLYYKENKIASLILKGGDKVHLITDTLGKNPRIDGSQESVLLSKVEKELRASLIKFDSLSVLYNNAHKIGNKTAADSLNLELGKIYVKQKQGALKHIFTNPYSLTNVVLLYQEFPGDLPLFADTKDALYFSRVYDSLKSAYPSSRYLSLIDKESRSRQNIELLNYKLENTSVMTLPEINLPDINSKMQSLNSLKGKVVVLFFWTVLSTEQKMYNKEMVDLYQKYSSKGLEIYQVSPDADKTAWGVLVKQQNLPWINVHDAGGTSSINLVNYNVQKLPTLYLINRNGEVVARDIFDFNELESRIKSLL